MEHGGSRPGAGRPTKNDPKLRKIFEKFSGLAKLNRIGKKEEQRVMKILETQGKLSDLDFALIRAYSLAFQEWNEAELSLQKQGLIIENSSGNPIANPYIRIRDNAFKRMLEIAKEMGFSIKSRSKLKFNDEEKDEFLEFLKGSNE
jgi:P27 family predicted phage terminase small subunit